LLHNRGDGESCECMAGREWVADFEYLIHDYLDRNPSRAENDVHKAKAKELKDSKLKQVVAARDRNTCRYCGITCNPADRKSDAGRTFDHVDPEVADGMSNLVVACRGCNNRKRRRTPEAAGMVLMPGIEEPGSAIRSAPESRSDLGSDLSPNTDPGVDTDPDPPPDPRPTPTGAVAGIWPVTSAETTGQIQTGGSPWTGRGGPGTAPNTGPPRPGPPTAHRIGPPTTPRGPLHGSPYLRSTRPLPEHHAGVPAPPPEPTDPPDYQWPPGSVPVAPREEDPS
jgi:hypothetical protein